MPNPDPETKVPFEDEAPEQGHVTEDRERVPGQPPVREGAPLVDPDRAPGAPDPGVPPGPGSPA